MFCFWLGLPRLAPGRQTHRQRLGASGLLGLLPRIAKPKARSVAQPKVAPHGIASGESVPPSHEKNES